MQFGDLAFRVMNPRVPVYWFCFAIAFGLICMVPVGTIRVSVADPGSVLILASAYDPSLARNWTVPWQYVLVMHTLAACFVAACAVLVLQLVDFSKDKRFSVVSTFKIRTLAVATVWIAIATALLRAFDASLVVIACAGVAIAVHPIASLLAVLLKRPTDDPNRATA